MLADHWQACFPENMVYENHLPVGEMVGAGILHRITDEAISYTHTHSSLRLNYKNFFEQKYSTKRRFQSAAGFREFHQKSNYGNNYCSSM